MDTANPSIRIEARVDPGAVEIDGVKLPLLRWLPKGYGTRADQGKRTVALTSKAAALLRDLPRGGPYVFISLQRLGEIGRRLRAGLGWQDARQPYANVCREFKDIQTKAGIPEDEQGRLHDLRHTVACRMRDEGVLAGVIARFLGDSEEMVIRTYFHAGDVLAEQVAVRKALGEIQGSTGAVDAKSAVAIA